MKLLSRLHPSSLNAESSLVDSRIAPLYSDLSFSFVPPLLRLLGELLAEESGATPFSYNRFKQTVSL
ncbi:hypothetical protein SDJN02_10349, partial [Cucurbita argyrosperma subsp. argyrosperma]